MGTEWHVTSQFEKSSVHSKYGIFEKSNTISVTNINRNRNKQAEISDVLFDRPIGPDNPIFFCRKIKEFPRSFSLFSSYSSRVHPLYFARFDSSGGWDLGLTQWKKRVNVRSFQVEYTGARSSFQSTGGS
jgi:hypothetical protein